MTEEKKAKRSGQTSVTSVSISKEFEQLITQYNLSPTECFRRGVAVTLFDLGVGMYQSQKNEERSKFMHEFLEKLEKDEQMKKEFENMKLFDEIRKHMSKIKKIAEEIENAKTE